jgi:hypothetical protein
MDKSAGSITSTRLCHFFRNFEGAGFVNQIHLDCLGLSAFTALQCFEPQGRWSTGSGLAQIHFRLTA